MNTLLEQVIAERNGHYCHCLEVETVQDLEAIAESIIDCEKDNHSEATIIEFLESAEVYCSEERNEAAVYAFSFADYIKDTI